MYVYLKFGENWTTNMGDMAKSQFFLSSFLFFSLNPSISKAACLMAAKQCRKPSRLGPDICRAGALLLRSCFVETLSIWLCRFVWRLGNMMGMNSTVGLFVLLNILTRGFYTIIFIAYTLVAMGSRRIRDLERCRHL